MSSDAVYLATGLNEPVWVVDLEPFPGTCAARDALLRRGRNLTSGNHNALDRRTPDAVYFEQVASNPSA
jgi:hypothetical protein